MQIAIAYIPCKDKEEAKRLSQGAIEEKLAVCGNIIAGMTSVYEWEGKLEESQESLLLLKHKISDFPLLRKWLIENHSYDTPCVTQINLHNTNSEYLDWVSKSLN